MVIGIGIGMWYVVCGMWYVVCGTVDGKNIAHVHETCHDGKTVHMLSCYPPKPPFFNVGLGRPLRACCKNVQYFFHPKGGSEEEENRRQKERSPPTLKKGVRGKHYPLLFTLTWLAYYSVS